jgi:exodeoxyribonuclease-5
MRNDWLNYATQSRRWDDRWRIRETLADIRHLYSCTTHTAQGSTYGTVFIDVRNLLLGGMADRMTRLKMFYTACTRPSLRLGVYWEPQGFL